MVDIHPMIHLWVIISRSKPGTQSFFLECNASIAPYLALKGLLSPSAKIEKIQLSCWERSPIYCIFPRAAKAACRNWPYLANKNESRANKTALRKKTTWNIPPAANAEFKENATLFLGAFNPSEGQMNACEVFKAPCERCAAFPLTCLPIIPHECKIVCAITKAR